MIAWLLKVPLSDANTPPYMIACRLKVPLSPVNNTSSVVRAGRRDFVQAAVTRV